MGIEGQGHFFTIYFQVLYVLCFTRPRYQVSVYRNILVLWFMHLTLRFSSGCQVSTFWESCSAVISTFYCILCNCYFSYFSFSEFGLWSSLLTFYLCYVLTWVLTLYLHISEHTLYQLFLLAKYLCQSML